MERKLIILYISCLSLTSAFAFTSTLTIPVIISFICTVVFFTKGIFDKGRFLTFEPEDIILILFLLSVYLGFFINYDRFKSNKPINHIFAYSYVIIVTYFLIKNTIYNLYYKYGISFLKSIYLTIFYALIATCLFGIAEFLLKNFYNVNIDSYIPRPAVAEYQPLALSSIVRLRSFVEESGHLAFYIEIFAPIAFFYIKNRDFLYYLYLLTVSICFILTFSTAGWLIATVTYLTLIISRINLNFLSNTIRINFKSISLTLIALSFLLALLIVNYDLLLFIVSVIDDTILVKIFQSGSAEDRTARFLEGFNAFINSSAINQILGNGPAVYDTLQFSRGGTILFYLTIVLESGILGLLFFLVFCLLLTFKVSKLKDLKLKFALQFALLSSFLHFFIISNYWYPWFWLLAVLIQLNYKIDYTTSKKVELNHLTNLQ